MSYDYYDPFAAMLPVTDPPSCSVWIDGVRFADGQLGEDDSEPVVLTGLKITWGRELSLEQPDPDTASFDVLDLLGGQTYLDKLHIGARCDVRTDATIYPDPTISMLPYGDFEDGIGYSYTLSPGIGLRTVGAEARTNRALNPRAVSTPTSGWVATRWGGPSGTAPYSYVTGLTGHPAGITTCRRKTWTKAPTSNGDTGFEIWASSGAPNVPWPATIGQAYVVSIWMRPTAGTPKSGNVAIYPLDAAGALTGSAINGPATPLPPNVWTRMSVTGVITAPLAVGFKVMADVDGSTNVWAVGDTLDATGLLIELGTAVDSYFDGDTPDAHGIDYSWSGAVNESASAATGNHRLQVLGSTGVNSGSVIFPPAPLSNDPSAWNNVPRSQPSQTWRGQGTLYMTSDLGTYVQTAALKPVAFRNPNGLDVVGLGYPFGQVTSATPGANVVGPTDFQPPADRWIGLAVDINPMGPRWSDPAAELSWDDLGSSPAWWNLGIVEIDDIKLLAPGEGVVLSGMVFSGLITDLDANYDLHKGGTVVSVIAQDWTADLGNRYIGAEPWAQDSLGNRFAGMVALAGQATTYKIDPGPAALSVSYRDVDNQPAYRLMAELATSAGGVLWSATNLVTGPYLWLEDIDTRLPLETLQKDPDGVIRIHLDTNTGAIEIDACLPLLEPVHWVQATNDDATRVVIQWKEQTHQAAQSTHHPRVADHRHHLSTGPR
jgi:hypothetical protein